MSKKISFSIILNAVADGFVGSIKTASTSLNAYEKTVKRVSRTNGNFATSFGAIGAAVSTATFIGVSQSIFTTATAIDSLNRGLKVLLGDSDLAGQKIEWLEQKGEALGIEFLSLADSYKNVLASGQGSELSEADIDRVFLSIATSSSALGMSVDDTNGSLRALGQMMSKDSIQAEELRGQLGERLPGAMNIMAEGLNVTSSELNKMMEDGVLKGEMLRTALLGFAGELEDKFASVAGEGLRAELNRLLNDFTKLKTSISEKGLFDVFIDSISAARKIISDPELVQGIVGIAKAFADFTISTVEFAAKNPLLIEGLVKLLAAVVALKVTGAIIGTIAATFSGLGAAINASELLLGAAALRSLAAAISLVSLALGAVAIGTLTGLYLEDKFNEDIIALRELREELELTKLEYEAFSDFKPENSTTDDFINNRIDDIVREKEALEKAFLYWSGEVQRLTIDSQETDIFGKPTANAEASIAKLDRAKGHVDELKVYIDNFASNIDLIYERVGQAGLDGLQQAKNASIASMDGLKAEYEKFADFEMLSDQEMKIRFTVESGDSDAVIAKKLSDIDEYKQGLIGAMRYYKAWAAELNKTVLDADASGEISVETTEARVKLAEVRSMIKGLGVEMDNFSTVSVSAYSAAETAGTESITTVTKVHGEKLKAMQEQYQAYADEVKRITEEIAAREQSLSEQLRSMARSGMDDVSAWNDMKAEADEYKQAAEEASNAGDFDTAVTMADKAKAAYARLNKEVKDGDKVVISSQDALSEAMRGVEEAGNLAIEALKGQREASYEAMEALFDESGFANLEAGMDGAKKKWLDNWVDMRNNAIDDIKAVEDRLVAIKDKEITVWINEKVRTAQEMASGGIAGVFPRRGYGEVNQGSGYRDDVRTMLKRGEFVHPLGAVRKYGYVAMNALKNLKINPKHLMSIVKGRIPHIPVGVNMGTLPQLSISMPLMPFNAPSADTVTINLVDDTTGQNIPISTKAGQDVDGLLRILRRRNRLSQ